MIRHAPHNKHSQSRVAGCVGWWVTAPVVVELVVVGPQEVREAIEEYPEN